MYSYMYICIWKYLFIYKYPFIYIYMYICIYVYGFMYVYLNIHMWLYYIYTPATAESHPPSSKSNLTTGSFKGAFKRTC
jgi:hypothetical protein